METPDEEPEWPSLEAVKFSLAVATTLNHRSTGVPKISVQPLFAQHRDKRSQQRPQQACVHEVRGCNDLLGRTTPHWRSGGIFVGRDGSVEAEEDRSEVGFRPFARVWLEFGLDVDNEGRADRGEKTGLKLWSTRTATNDIQTRTKIKVVLRSSLCFCMYSVSYSIVSRLYMV